MKSKTPTLTKPGFKTSEFWLSTLVILCGILMSSGAIAEESTAARIIGGIMAVLAALGYTGTRAQVKKTESANALEIEFEKIRNALDESTIRNPDRDSENFR
jgi:hypothetical protein